MRTSEELVEGLHQHMENRRQRKARLKYRIISSAAVAVCLVAAVLIGVVVSQNPAGRAEVINGSVSASIFAEHAALGYVVVSLAAFCLGALVTVFCMRLKKHMDGEEQDNARSD